MTTKELRDYFNTTYGLKPWPSSYEVDAETYGNVCDEIIKHLVENIKMYFYWDQLGNGPTDKRVSIAIGEHNGIMFKNVELILKK